MPVKCQSKVRDCCTKVEIDMTNKEDRYKYYLTGMHNHTFPDEQVARNYVFSNEEHFCFKPQHIYSYFVDLAYGTPAPTMNDTPKKLGAQH